MHARKPIAALFAIGAIAASTMATAADAANTKEIARNLGTVLKDVPIEKIATDKRTGLYEVVTPRGIFYTDKTGSFLIYGTVLDSKTGANLTEQRADELSKFNFADFPFKDAIKTVRGNGSRTMVTFEDPNCGFCKKLMQEVNKLDNVTVYTFLVPILSPDSAVKSKAIWCSADRAKTWTDFMANGAALGEPGNCDVPFERNLALQQKLRIAGTPAIYFKDNSKFKGYVKADQIEAKLQ